MKDNLKKFILIIFLVLLVGLAGLSLNFLVNSKSYCANNCFGVNHNETNEDCGYWYKFPNCDESKAPEKAPFGSKYYKKENWCYELEGGRCGEYGSFLVFLCLFIFIVGVILAIIFSLIPEILKGGKENAGN